MTTTLTPELISAEPAGNRLDVWVAERVMGWRNDPLGGWLRQYPEHDDKWLWSNWLSVEPTFRLGEDGHEYQEPFQMIGTVRFAPSIDIAAAWEVVEKFRKAGWYVDVRARDYSESDHSFGCEMTDAESDPLYVEAAAAPLAICRAALLATLNHKEQS